MGLVVAPNAADRLPASTGKLCRRTAYKLGRTVNPIQPVPATRRDLNNNLPFDDMGFAHDVPCPRCRTDGQGRLANNGGFIDRRYPFQDRAVGGNDLTAFDEKNVSLAKFRRCDCL
jgi:hypothetical protein